MTKQRQNAPREMIRGSAAVDSANVYMYITPWQSSEIYEYNIHEDKWRNLPESPYQDSGLVMMNNALFSVGGHKFGTDVPTNKLFRLQGEEWKEHFPNMNTARSSPALAAHTKYTFVIGGHARYRNISSVEVISEENNTWSIQVLGHIPHPFQHPSATLCGEQLYVLSGGDDNEGYCCSLQEMLTSSHPIESLPVLTWTRIPLPPVHQSTIATLSRQTVLVGGTMRGSDTRSSTVYSLSRGQWVECGHFCEARFHCLAVSISQKIVVVGGWDSSGWSSTAKVESLSVV